MRTTVPAGMEPTGSDPNGDYAMLTRKSTGSIGAAKLLKVMAGDRIHTSVEYFYPGTAADNSGTNTLTNILTSIAAALDAGSAASAVLHGEGKYHLFAAQQQ